MHRKLDQFMRSRQSVLRWLLFCFAPFIFLLAGGILVVISFVVSDVILSPFTDNSTALYINIWLYGYIWAFLFYVFVGVPFSVFTYEVARVEKSTFHPLLDNIRQVFFYYLFFISLLVQRYDILYLAFIPGYDPLAQMLTEEKRLADWAFVLFGLFLTIIITNLVVLFILRKRKKSLL